MKALTVSEMNQVLIEMIKKFDPTNQTLSKSIFGSYDIHLIFKGGYIRATESSDGDSQIKIYGFDEKFRTDKKYLVGSYAKLSTTLKKEFYEMVTNANYEMCVDKNGFAWIQEPDAEKEAYETLYGGEGEMNIVKRIKL